VTTVNCDSNCNKLQHLRTFDVMTITGVFKLEHGENLWESINLESGKFTFRSHDRWTDTSEILHLNFRSGYFVQETSPKFSATSNVWRRHGFEGGGTISRTERTKKNLDPSFCWGTWNRTLHIFRHCKYDVLTCTKWNYMTVFRSCQKVKYVIE